MYNTQELEYIDENHPYCYKQINLKDNSITEQKIYKRCKNTNIVCENNIDCPSFQNYTTTPKSIQEALELIESIKYDDYCVKYCLPVNVNCNQEQSSNIVESNQINLNQIKFIQIKKDGSESYVSKICKSIQFYQNFPECYIFKNTIEKCENIYSKEICLQVVEQCYFDIKQGGCNYKEQDYIQTVFKGQ